MLALCKRFEGCRLIAYLCPARVWTCGWGSTGPDVKQGTTWSQTYADARLQVDADAHWREAMRISPILWTLPVQVGAAIGDFVFNLGPAAYRASTLRKRIDAMDWHGAAQELAKWVFGGGKKLPGLVLRRAAEAQMILSTMVDNQ